MKAPTAARYSFSLAYCITKHNVQMIPLNQTIL